MQEGGSGNGSGEGNGYGNGGSGGDGAGSGAGGGGGDQLNLEGREPTFIDVSNMEIVSKKIYMRVDFNSNLKINFVIELEN